MPCLCVLKLLRLWAVPVVGACGWCLCDETLCGAVCGVCVLCLCAASVCRV